MSAVPPSEIVHHPVTERSRKRIFSFYPILGIALVILVAVLSYGGLFLLLSIG